MKKTLIILLLVIVYQKGNSQNSQLTFLYDSAGNQVSRIFVDNTNPQAKGGKTKTIADEDFIKIFPNPTKGILKIDWTENLGFEIVKISIADNQGNQWNVNFKQKDETFVTIDLSNKATGLYIVRFELSNNETIIRKIIKI